MVAIEIPEGVTVTLDGFNVKVKGPKGEVEKNLFHPRVAIKSGNGKVNVDVKAKKKIKKDKMVTNTFASHINNLIKGATDGYEYKLKICSGHFPMTVTVSGAEVAVKNFLGEKVPRKAKIAGDVKIEVKGDEIIVTGRNKELVGQAAAKIEQLTRVVNRDRRIFQDGCYIVSKDGKAVMK